MAELRRLLIAPDRLNALDGASQTLVLDSTEQHYLRRVLRCRVGDEVAVVDGVGSLWTALLTAGDALTLPAVLISSNRPRRHGLVWPSP